MNPVDLIIRKRNGQSLDQAAIQAFVTGVCSDSWPDYQVSAMLMAMFIRGLDNRETLDLTLAMAASGHQLDLSAIPGIKVDKHSTGGVADTTTLILVPLLAACGLPVIKMSGRGLGFTGGTIDKLESIPGFCTDLDEKSAIAQAAAINMVILSQTENLTPADRKLYAMRDVTGTIDSIPLIAASIMSKKIAAGADAIMLDVKCGSGAFMRQESDARLLARTMVDIGRKAGREVRALISRMDQPLGQYIGNSLEVLEAILILKGQAKGDLLDVTLTLGSHMLCMADSCQDLEHGRALLQEQIDHGRGLACFRRLIAAQGGDPEIVDHLDLLPQAACRKTLVSSHGGYVQQMDTEALGRAFVEAGGGRKQKNDPIDPSAGLIICPRLADQIQPGQALAEIFCASEKLAEQVMGIVKKAIIITEKKPSVSPAVIDVIF